MRVIITARAERDFTGHVQYVRERNPKAALAMYESILGQIMSLQDLPYRARQGRVPGTRELIISKYPYIVVFEISGDDVVILHVNHSAQQWPREAANEPDQDDDED